jgi:hypothetical protein
MFPSPLRTLAAFALAYVGGAVTLLAVHAYGRAMHRRGERARASLTD